VTPARVKRLKRSENFHIGNRCERGHAHEYAGWYTSGTERRMSAGGGRQREVSQRSRRRLSDDEVCGNWESLLHNS
jgi:hypothetical protein